MRSSASWRRSARRSLRTHCGPTATRKIVQVPASAATACATPADARSVTNSVAAAASPTSSTSVVTLRVRSTATRFFQRIARAGCPDVASRRSVGTFRSTGVGAPPARRRASASARRIDTSAAVSSNAVSDRSTHRQCSASSAAAGPIADAHALAFGLVSGRAAARRGQSSSRASGRAAAASSAATIAVRLAAPAESAGAAAAMLHTTAAAVAATATSVGHRRARPTLPCSASALRTKAAPRRCSARVDSSTQMAIIRRQVPASAPRPDSSTVQRAVFSNTTSCERKSLYPTSSRRVSGAGKRNETSALEKASVRRSAPNSHAHTTAAPRPSATGSSRADPAENGAAERRWPPSTTIRYAAPNTTAAA